MIHRDSALRHGGLYLRGLLGGLVIRAASRERGKRLFVAKRA
jgi:hypothetical protein